MVAKRRDGRRKEQRRAKYYTIHEETAAAAAAAAAATGEGSDEQLNLAAARPRVQMSQEEALQLFSAIRQNLTSRFGIVRMAELDLDRAYDICSLDSPAAAAAGTTSAPAMSTLLAYSILRGRDKITSQLLRAGANAACCLDVTSDAHGLSQALSLQVRRRLMLLPGAPRTYLVNMFVAFHIASSSSSSSSSSSAGSECMCPCGQPATLTVQPCFHRVCEECYWRQVLLCTARCKHDDVTCPHSDCGGATVMAAPEETGSPAQVQVCTVQELALAAGADAGVEAEAEAIKLRALSLFRALPATVAEAAVETKASSASDGGGSTNGKRHPNRLHLSDGSFNTTFRLSSASASVAALFCLHHTQEQRSEELLRAAQEGYTQRVLELVKVGCDLEATNECGVTPLVAAVYGRHACTAMALLQCGAAAGAKDRLGRSPLQVARATGCQDMIQALLLYTPAEMKVPEVQVAPQWQQHGVGWSSGGTVTSLAEPQHAQLCPSEAFASPGKEEAVRAPVWQGADSYTLDGAFTEPFLEHLEQVFREDLATHVQTGCRGNSANNAGAADRNRGQQLEALLASFASSDKLAFSDRAMFADSTGDFVARVIRAVLHHYSGSCTGGGGVACSNILPSMRFIRYRVHGACSPPHVDLVKAGEALEFPVGEEAEQEAEPGVVSSSGQIRSTHTFILYLSTCPVGGETALLRKIPTDARVANASRIARNRRRNAKRERRRLERGGLPRPAPHAHAECQEQVSPKAEVLATSETSEAEVEVAGVNKDEGEDEKEEEGEEEEEEEAYNEAANTIYAVQPVRGRLLFFPHNHPHEGRAVVLPPGQEAHKLILRGEMF